MKHLGSELQKEYALRFSELHDYRKAVWRVLIDRYFQPKFGEDLVTLDLGAGWGEFVNQFSAKKKFAMDLNPDTRSKLEPDVTFLEQDCSHTWNLEDESLDLIFTSNFFEHLREKTLLDETLSEAYRCLKPGGRIACLGPNIKYLAADYWDFYDHYLPLSHLSLSEALQLRGFEVTSCIDRFLPYTMAGGSRPHIQFVRFYLQIPLAWRLFGKQFIVVAQRPNLV